MARLCRLVVKVASWYSFFAAHRVWDSMLIFRFVKESSIAKAAAPKQSKTTNDFHMISVLFSQILNLNF